MSKKDERGQRFDGVQAVIDMFKVMDLAEREKLLIDITEKDPRLAEKIKLELFSFEDFAQLSDRSLQTFLRRVPPDKLVLALKTGSEAVREKFCRNLSMKRAEQLRTDLATLGPQKKSVIDSSQQDLVNLAIEMEKNGEITLRSSRKDDQWVE